MDNGDFDCDRESGELASAFRVGMAVVEAGDFDAIPGSVFAEIGRAVIEKHTAYEYDEWTSIVERD